MSEEPVKQDPSASTDAATSGTGLLGSWLSPETRSKAWGLWDTVKNNPHVVQAQEQAQIAQQQVQERIQQAQKQAQEMWSQYDSAELRERISEIQKSAVNYIDEADRKLETFENGAVQYLQQRGGELVDKVKETAGTAAGDSGSVPAQGEVLFADHSEQDHTPPTSRVEAELRELHSSPARILSRSTPSTRDAIPSLQEIDTLLADTPQLAKLHDELVPAKLSDTEFWSRYFALRKDIEDQDRRRKQLIESQAETKPGTYDPDLDSWGSSDEDEPETSKKPTAEADVPSETATKSTAKKQGKKKSSDPSAEPTESITNGDSDSEWD